MKNADFNALTAHIEKETQGFKRHYKLYGDVYILRNSNKTESLEFRFIRSDLVCVKKYNLIKDEKNQIVGEVLTNESTYTFTSVQSVKILKLFESIC